MRQSVTTKPKTEIDRAATQRAVTRPKPEVDAAVFMSVRPNTIQRLGCCTSSHTTGKATLRKATRQNNGE